MIDTETLLEMVKNSPSYKRFQNKERINKKNREAQHRIDEATKREVEDSIYESITGITGSNK